MPLQEEAETMSVCLHLSLLTVSTRAHTLHIPFSSCLAIMNTSGHGFLDHQMMQEKTWVSLITGSK